MIKQINEYTAGYSKGAFAMALQLHNNLLNNVETLFGDCRSEKQYHKRLEGILKYLAENQLERENFLLKGKIQSIKVDKDGKVIEVKC